MLSSLKGHMSKAAKQRTEAKAKSKTDQCERFHQTARDLGVSNDKSVEAFERAFLKIVAATRLPSFQAGSVGGILAAPNCRAKPDSGGGSWAREWCIRAKQAASERALNSAVANERLAVAIEDSLVRSSCDTQPDSTVELHIPKLRKGSYFPAFLEQRPHR